MQTKPYAIIQLAGKQHKISAGDKLTLNRLPNEEDKTFKTTDVLLYSDDKDTQIGTPLVKGVTVEIKVLEHNKAKKIRVAKFRSKSRYRKVYGHRQRESLLEVISIKKK